MRHESALTEEESRAAFERISKALLEHNASQGVNYWAGSPHPTMLIWAGRIFDFLEVLERTLGFPAAAAQSYAVGYRSGVDGAAVNLDLASDVPEAERPWKVLLGGNVVLSGAGWGRAAIVYEEEPPQVEWTFPEGTAFALASRQRAERERLGARRDPACAFMSGYIAGWTNRCLGTQLEVEERECAARGDPRCRFESTPYRRIRSGAPPTS